MSMRLFESLTRGARRDFMRVHEGANMMIVRTNRYLPKDDLYRKIDAGLAVKGWNLEDLAREVLKEFGKILVTGKRTPAKLQNTIATTFRKRTGSSKWF